MTRRRNPNPAARHLWHAPDGQTYPLIDAPASTRIILPAPSSEDVAGAATSDPNNCAIARCWMRTNSVPVAQIGVHYAYIPIWKNGQIKVMRTRVPKSTAEIIEHFDQTGEWPEKTNVELRGISKSARLDSKRAEAKRTRDRWQKMGEPRRKKRVRVHLRDASRRAQVTVE